MHAAGVRFPGERRRVEGIEAHRVAAKRRGHPRQVGSVGDEGDVVKEPGMAARRPTRSGSQGRRSGSPPVNLTLRTPCAARRPANPGDFLECQENFQLQELVGGPIDLGRHAVRAAGVARIDDGDAQVVERTAEPAHHRRLVADVTQAWKHTHSISCGQRTVLFTRRRARGSLGRQVADGEHASSSRPGGFQRIGQRRVRAPLPPAWPPVRKGQVRGPGASGLPGHARILHLFGRCRRFPRSADREIQGGTGVTRAGTMPARRRAPGRASRPVSHGPGERESARYLCVQLGTGIAPFHCLLRSYPSMELLALHGVRSLQERWEYESFDPSGCSVVSAAREAPGSGNPGGCATRWTRPGGATSAATATWISTRPSSILRDGGIPASTFTRRCYF